MSVLRIALLVLKKDFAIELRSYEILSTTLFFAVACVAIFSFAFVKEGQAVVDAAAGILWIAIAFSGTLALGRTFERERYGETLKALLLAPALMTLSPEAHAKDVVTATLTDFRGLDTLGEASVIAVTLIGVYALVLGDRL